MSAWEPTGTVPSWLEVKQIICDIYEISSQSSHIKKKKNIKEGRNKREKKRQIVKDSNMDKKFTLHTKKICDEF